MKMLILKVIVVLLMLYMIVAIFNCYWPASMFEEFFCIFDPLF